MCHGVTVTMSDMKTAQKKHKDKIFNENLILHWQTKKMAKFHKMVKGVFSWSTQLKNGHIWQPWMAPQLDLEGAEVTKCLENIDHWYSG